MNRILIFDPSLASDNGGDKIILDYCLKVLEKVFPSDYLVHIPTQDRLGNVARSFGKRNKYEILCGTNLLSAHMGPWRQWRITLRDTKYLNNICLMGVGWWQYENKKMSPYAKMIYQKALSHHLLHSVRDSYTENRLKEMGIDNVVNTGCPTMWGLTKELCKEIPHKKADKVITTITCYHRAPEKDRIFLDILLNEYKEVYLWIQTIDDYDYVKNFYDINKFQIIAPNLQSLDKVLNEENIDYCGTRLHAGIRALNYRKRCIVIANDNRALEISKDTGLPVVRLEEVNSHLEKYINMSFETKINMPYRNIEKWIRQFQDS